MTQELEKLIKAREVLTKIAEGINPLNGQPINEKDFIHDPRIIRNFYQISEVMNDMIRFKARSHMKKLTDFVITEEEKQRVALPENKVGVTEFAKRVNMVIDPYKSRRLTGAELNRQLKRMGILGETAGADGKSRTVVNEKSGEYGIETETRSYNGSEYEMIVFNEAGKRFLLDNLEKIMSC